MVPMIRHTEQIIEKETNIQKIEAKDDVEVYKFLFNLLLGEKVPEQRVE